MPLSKGDKRGPHELLAVYRVLDAKFHRETTVKVLAGLAISKKNIGGRQSTV